MAHHDRSRPAIECLERRQLLTNLFPPLISSAYGSTYSRSIASRVALVRHEDHVFVSELQQIELNSQATPAQYLALRDDARAFSEAASTTALNPQTANEKALAVSLELDRAALEGWVGDPGWSTIGARLTSSLNGLNVSSAIIGQTITDMRAIATSAGVTSAEYEKYSDDFNTLRDAESSLPSGYAHFPDPSLYFTQHLRGFFRGGAVQRHADQAKLDADVQSIGAGSHGTATLRRDAQLLEQIGAGLTSETNLQLDDAFAAGFQQGAPNGPALAQLKASFQAALNQGGDSAALSAVDRLIADAPNFFRAAGSSPDNVRTIVGDVQALVADGGDSPLNPFKVEISPNPSS